MRKIQTIFRVKKKIRDYIFIIFNFSPIKYRKIVCLFLLKIFLNNYVCFMTEYDNISNLIIFYLRVEKLN